MRIAIALCLFTSVAVAGNHEVTWGVSTRALRTSSANAVTKDSLGGGAVGYAHVLPIELVPGLELWAAGNLSWGGADGTLFQTLTTDLDTLAITAGAHARYELYSHIVANARIDLGAAHTSLAIRDGAGHTASDAGWSAVTEGAVGLDLYALYWPRLSLGLRVELGYIATTNTPFTATPESDSEDMLELEMSPASLGSINLSGPVFAASVVGQF